MEQIPRSVAVAATDVLHRQLEEGQQDETEKKGKDQCPSRVNVTGCRVGFR
jgi:hypothetical protein